VALKGKYPLRTKIVTEDKTLVQVNHFSYLGYDATFLEETNADIKIRKLQNTCVTIRRTLKGKNTPIKCYQVMAFATLLYGSECWEIRKRDMQKLKTVEMQFLKSVKGYKRLDKRRNEDVGKQLLVFSTNEKIRRLRQEWFEHAERKKEEGRMSKQAFGLGPREEDFLADPAKGGIH
jgi:hypothetical protein